MWTSLIIIGHIIVIIGVSVRIIMMRLPVGTALAWIILIFFLPFAGAVIYLVLGEKRLGRKRTRRAASLWGRYNRWLRELPRQAPDERSGLSPEAAAISRLPEGALGFPVLSGNRALQREPGPVVQSAALIRYKGEPTCWKVF